MHRIDAVVVGAGVVGLAIARTLAMAGRETLIVERAATIGSETSSRNSEVIHAGIYYPQGSLKARLCVAGRDMLYAHCASRKVDHRRTGKLIVATNDTQRADLGRIAAAAYANGVEDLAMLDASEAARMEPALVCVAALHSPSTGIVDSHGLMLSLLGDAEAHGAVVAYRTEIAALAVDGAGIAVTLAGEDRPSLVADLLVNAAGLDAPALAARTRGLDPAHVPQAWLARGCYFGLSGRSPFSRLIYPVPEPGGLGTHLTLDLAGQARFGPDVEWVEKLDYSVDPARAEGFYRAIRAYWPELRDGQLTPAYAGIRPKLSGPGQPAADFRIDGPAAHGIHGLINLFGIESPGLTASLAIADLVGRIAEGERDA